MPRAGRLIEYGHRRNRAADADLAARGLSGRTRAERRARTGDLLQITKALLIRER
jgi:hypothetical protein